jgi:hypothetical protein
MGPPARAFAGGEGRATGLARLLTRRMHRSGAARRRAEEGARRGMVVGGGADGAQESARSRVCAGRARAPDWKGPPRTLWPSWMSLSMPRGPRVVRTASATAWQALMLEMSWALPWLSSVPSRRRITPGWSCPWPAALKNAMAGEGRGCGGGGDLRKGKGERGGIRAKTRARGEEEIPRRDKSLLGRAPHLFASAQSSAPPRPGSCRGGGGEARAAPPRGREVGGGGEDCGRARHHRRRNRAPSCVLLAPAAGGSRSWSGAGPGA